MVSLRIWPAAGVLQVHFNVYIIHDNSRHIKQVHPVHFDMEHFKAQLQRLALPSQHFSFSSKSINMLDDPTLASAFAISLRTSFAEVPHAVAEPVGMHTFAMMRQLCHLCQLCTCHSIWGLLPWQVVYILTYNSIHTCRVTSAQGCQQTVQRHRHAPTVV